jgi:Rps23 Pro-64 3,4-dihydroxylase Tpa1-like proline 4-hydroxylase
LVVPAVLVVQASVPSPTPRVVRHPVAVIDDFLPDTEWRALLAGTLAREASFVPSATHDARADYRQSWVLNPPAELVAPVVSRVRTLVPRALAELRLPQPSAATIEAQLTASVDGSFFKVHTDAGTMAQKRLLTYVYYFQRAPGVFSGGDLRVYDDVVRNGKLARGETFRVVEPRHNRIVFFWAKTMHEVTDVHVPSRAFADSRFTVNGWINAA